jgi:hypothetical protein
VFHTLLRKDMPRLAFSYFNFPGYYKNKETS